MSKTILAIDDNREFLATLKKILEDEGYNIKAISDPMLTEECIDKYSPDLLIIDIFMPKRSGFNLLEDFEEKHRYKDIPKIFITGLDDDVEKMVAKACGAEYYITKPLNPEELIECVNNILNKL